MMTLRFIVDTCMIVKIKMKAGQKDEIPHYLEILEDILADSSVKMAPETHFLVQNTYKAGVAYLDIVHA